MMVTTRTLYKIQKYFVMTIDKRRISRKKCVVLNYFRGRYGDNLIIIATFNEVIGHWVHLNVPTRFFSYLAKMCIVNANIKTVKLFALKVND